jgi:tRNA nucleotidyltransferase/poly(A) polymerase
VVAKLRRAEHTAFLVGGGVRDMMMGLAPKDFDVVTSAKPEQVRSVFSRTIPTGEQFGVVTVIFEGKPFEVATYRAEGGYSDRRRPDWVRYADLQADLARRDFTINGLVLDPAESVVHDWVDGLGDLQRRVLRTIGNPDERFGEDALRMMRAVRFAARFELTVDPSTWRAIVEHAGLIGRIAAERVWAELAALYSHRSRAVAHELLRSSGLLRLLVPELATEDAGGGVGEPRPDQAPCRLRTLPDDAAPPVVWACVLADSAAPEMPASSDEDGPHDPAAPSRVSEVLRRLRAPRRLARVVGEALERRWVWRVADRIRPGSLARLLRHDAEGALRGVWVADAVCSGAEPVARHIASVVDRLNESGRMADGTDRPPATGDDLLEWGVPSGPHMKRLLAEIERLWLEGSIAHLDDARAWVRRAGDDRQPPDRT